MTVQKPGEGQEPCPLGRIQFRLLQGSHEETHLSESLPDVSRVLFRDFHPVQLREGLIDEGPAGGEQTCKGSRAVKNLPIHKQLCFRPHRRLNHLVEIIRGILRPDSREIDGEVHTVSTNGIELQKLSVEVLNPLLTPPILQHPTGLGGNSLGTVQPSNRRGLQKSRIRNTVPEQSSHSSRQFIGSERGIPLRRFHFRISKLGIVEKVRGLEDELKGQGIPLVASKFLNPFLIRRGDQRLFLVFEGSSPCTLRQVLKALFHAVLKSLIHLVSTPEMIFQFTIEELTHRYRSVVVRLHQRGRCHIHSRIVVEIIQFQSQGERTGIRQVIG